MVKYIKGGKETVKYNMITGDCFVEQTKGGETKNIRIYKKDIDNLENR